MEKTNIQSIFYFVKLLCLIQLFLAVHGERFDNFGVKHEIPDNKIEEFKDDVLNMNSNPELNEYAKNWTVKFRPFLKNWITYYDNNFEKAGEMLLKTLEWRQNNNLDSLVDWDPKNGFNRNDFPYRVTGYSNDGSPVAFFPIGMWDHRQALRNGYQKELLLHFLSAAESLFNEAIKNGTKTGEGIGIVDMTGFSLSQLSSIRVVNYILSVARLTETHYPLYAKRIFVINAPGYFSLIFDLMKNVLSSKALKLISIYGTNKNEWLEIIREYVPEYAIPKEIL